MRWRLYPWSYVFFARHSFLKIEDNGTQSSLRKTLRSVAKFLLIGTIMDDYVIGADDNVF